MRSTLRYLTTRRDHEPEAVRITQPHHSNSRLLFRFALEPPAALLDRLGKRIDVLSRGELQCEAGAFHPVPPGAAFVLTDQDADVARLERRTRQLSAALELLLDVEAQLVAVPCQTFLNVFDGEHRRDGTS